MAGISQLLDIGTSALATFQRALTATGHNLANVHTPGFSRQEAVLSERPPVDGNPGQVGTGVRVSSIRRPIDKFLEDQLLASHEQRGRYEAAQTVLSQIQSLFGDASDYGIGTALNEFFAAVQDIATNPADVTARTVALSRAGTLAGRVNQASAALIEQRQAVDRHITQSIAEINDLASQIAALNARIRDVQLSGQNPNDLLDERGRLVNALGALIDVTPLQNDDGQLTLFTGRGQLLVEQQHSYKLVGLATAGTGVVDVRYDPGGGSLISITSLISGGRLKGLIEVRDQTIAPLLTSLDTLASEIVTRVNLQHRVGFGLDGSTGVDFFSPTGTAANTMAMAITDPRRVAASSAAAGLPGNNANALLLGALQGTTFAALGTQTFSGFYGSLASNLGATTQTAQRDAAAQDILHGQLEAHRAAVSGVSSDEELINILKYQRAFEAASRLIVTADELLQTLLDMKR
jgi:flagellar hook-associated protein 1 FlgK